MVTQLSHEQLSALRRIDSPTISNAIETFKLRPHVAGYVGYDIHCIFPELPLYSRC
jgi:4-hydroxy-4-methyl-2-oxoglutarate aldolase